MGPRFRIDVQRLTDYVSAHMNESLPPALQNLRVALVHYWLVRRRGGEKVLEALADMFPEADVFTLLLDRNEIGPCLQNRTITTSFLQHIPGIRRHYQKFLPLCPLALENFNLDAYDLVISSESGPAKGVITGSHTYHLCYCHTPMRYVWDMYFEYKKSTPGGRLGRAFFSLVGHYMRIWDSYSAARVDHFVANSQHVANRIRKTYRREAEVVYPPVVMDENTGDEYPRADEPGDFYLVAGQLVRYKRIDLAIEACNRLSRKLIVIGDGEELKRLHQIAGPTVTILGWQSNEVLLQHYRCCRALLFPGEEDFGMTPVEAQASGRPVIAFGRGGALETIRGYFNDEGSFFPDCSGVFFREPSVESLSAAILSFEKNEHKFCQRRIRENARIFDHRRFRLEMTKVLVSGIEQFRRLHNLSPRHPKLETVV